MPWMVYDASGNLADAGGGWTFTYDATGQQTYSAVGNLQNWYDGDRLRGKKSENGAVTYYLRSSVLGGQVVAEIAANGDWARGFVYSGGDLLAVQQAGVFWIHQDPGVKSKRITDAAGNVVSTVELDPWGGETNRSNTEGFQPRKFDTYLRDAIGSDDAMHRRYNRWWARFEQPDPYDGSYDLTSPQSFNRYSYVNNDPVNFVDPLGLDPDDALGALGTALGPIAGMGPPRAFVDVPNDGGVLDTIGDGGEVRMALAPLGRQNPTPEELLKTGKAEAENRLKNDSCAKFFGGSDKGLKALNSLKLTIDPSMPKNGHPQAEILGNNVRVNPNGGLVIPDGEGFTFILVENNKSTNRILTVKLFGADARAFGQLHETGHKAKRFGNTDNDTWPHRIMNGYQNNFKIWKSCFSDTPTQPWQGQPPIFQ